MTVPRRSVRRRRTVRDGSARGGAVPDQGARDGAALDGVADDYVRLVLVIGRHDPDYVDAYYGPPAWKKAAARGRPRPLPELLKRARALLARAHSAPACARRDFLERQLVALEAFVRKRSGETLELGREARLLFDIEVPVHEVEEFERERARLESLLPGKGDLAGRYRGFCDRFLIPPSRLEAVVQACFEATRARTVACVQLPPGERLEACFVRGRPWRAYSWYQGGYRSRIEVNAELSFSLGRLLDVLAHEGYPGHHTCNSLVEERLVRGRGWREFTVLPLYSPQTLMAEGTAEVGLSIIMTREEKRACLRDALGPVAGLAGLDFETYVAVREAARPLDVLAAEALRRLLAEGWTEKRALAFIARHAFVRDDSARNIVAFARAYGSYVFSYTAGDALVRAYVGDGPGRVARFFDLYRTPAVPSGLVGPQGG